MLTINNLCVEGEKKLLLKGVNLSIKKGEIHALMGPNGAGKSTFCRVLAGYPSYRVVDGEIIFEGRDITKLSVEERAHLGVFLSFQHPIEIEGVTNFQFLFAAVNAQRKAKGQKLIDENTFTYHLNDNMKLLELKHHFISRGVNWGFSGGEKKRSEILQMALLQPKLAILDEVDSGIDVDSLRIIARGIKKIISPQRSLLIISHYSRFFEYIPPHFVHVMLAGQIVASNQDPHLTREIEKRGYEKVFGK